MNITVYLGANEGNDPSLKEAVRALGTWIGNAGHALVYGGSKSGLMGELAESVLHAGGIVTGVEPQFFIDAGFEYNAVTKLIVTKDSYAAAYCRDNGLVYKELPELVTEP